MIGPGIHGYCKVCNWRFKCPFDFKDTVSNTSNILLEGLNVYAYIVSDGIERIGPLKCVIKYKNKIILNIPVSTQMVKLKVLLRHSFIKEFNKGRNVC